MSIKLYLMQDPLQLPPSAQFYSQLAFERLLHAITPFRLFYITY